MSLDLRNSSVIYIIIIIPILKKRKLSPMELGGEVRLIANGAEPQTQGCLTAPSALPGHRPLGGEQAQHHQPLPCIGACCGEVCVCPTI